MQYLNTIKMAIMIFPLIALIITIPFILSQYHKYGSIHKLRTLIIYSFILYLMVIYFLVILPLPTRTQVLHMPTKHIQLIPFSFIKDIGKETTFNILNPKTYYNSLMHPSVYTMLFNILMIIPFGMYLRYYYKCNLKKTFILSLSLSLFFELTQLSGLYGIYKKAYRLCDIDDLITNTTGGVLGYFIMGLFINFLPSRDKIDSDTIEKGKEVSGLRRLTTFILDIFIYFVISTPFNILFNSKIVTSIVFVSYFIIIPLITDGKTLSRMFLNLKVSCDNKKLVRIALRSILIYLFYYELPQLVIKLITTMSTYFKFSRNINLIINILSLTLLMIFYLVCFIKILKNKKMVYEKITKTTLISTIGENTNKNLEIEGK